jgi:crotonobetainyl-CoA:carnitine CoA-transferase CaiB-like acyl-CoA transferase
VLAGPAVGMFFAELGAEVVKIENKTAGGDVTRQWKLPGEDPVSPISAYWCSVNWGKQYQALDFNDANDLAAAAGLIAAADVVISNLKPSAARRWRLDAATLRARHPRLIFAQLDAFPEVGDERPAFDVVLQAEAGFLHMTGEPGRPPVRMPVALIDLIAAHQLKEGVLLALLHRERTGHGSVVTTSLLESALASLANQATNYLMADHVPGPLGTQHPNIAPYGDVYTAADGLPVLLAVGTERQFQQLCAALERMELPDNPDFATNTARVQHRDALNAVLQEAIAGVPGAALLERLHRLGVPAARIRDMRAVFELPVAREMVLEEEQAGRATQRLRTVAFGWEPGPDLRLS